MNINSLTNYVNQDVDDTFTVQDISRWFNKGIAQYNLLPPLTLYPLVVYGVTANPQEGIYNEQTNYPLDDTFMLGIMLPYIVASVRASEASITERQLHLQDFAINASTFKKSIDVPLTWMRNKKNEDLSAYEIGEGIYLGDFTRSPFAGDWQRPSIFDEIVAEEEE